MEKTNLEKATVVSVGEECTLDDLVSDEWKFAYSEKRKEYWVKGNDILTYDLIEKYVENIEENNLLKN